MAKKTISFRCEEKLEEAIRKMAKKLGVSMADAIQGSIVRGALIWQSDEKAKQEYEATSIAIANSEDLADKS